MRKTVLALLVLAVSLPFLAAPAAAQQAPPAFDEYFVDKALRIDLFQSGDAKDERVTVHQHLRRGDLAGIEDRPPPALRPGPLRPQGLRCRLQPSCFPAGFDTMYAEYKTTSPGPGRRRRVFERSVRHPPAQAARSLRRREARQAQPPPSDLRPDHRSGRLPHHPGDARARATRSSRSRSRAIRTTRSISSSWPRATRPATRTSSRPTSAG